MIIHDRKKDVWKLFEYENAYKEIVTFDHFMSVLRSRSGQIGKMIEVDEELQLVYANKLTGDGFEILTEGEINWFLPGEIQDYHPTIIDEPGVDGTGTSAVNGLIVTTQQKATAPDAYVTQGKEGICGFYTKSIEPIERGGYGVPLEVQPQNMYLFSSGLGLHPETKGMFFSCQDYNRKVQQELMDNKPPFWNALWETLND